MKKIIFLTAAFLITFQTFAQQDPVPMPQMKKHPLYALASDAFDKQNWNTALPYWEKLIKKYPDMAAPYKNAATCLMTTGDLQQYARAKEYALYSTELFPLSFSSYVPLVLLNMMNAQDADAMQALKTAVSIGGPQEDFDYLIANLNSYANYYASSNPSLAAKYKGMMSYANEHHANGNAFFKLYLQYDKTLDASQDGNDGPALTALEEIKKYIWANDVPKDIYYFLAWYTVKYLSKGATPALTAELIKGYKEVADPYLKSKLFDYYVVPLNQKRDYESVAAEGRILLDEISKRPVLMPALISVYCELCEDYSLGNKQNNARGIAKELEDVKDAYESPRLKLEICEALCAVYFHSADKAEQQKSIRYGEEGLAIAKAQNLNSLSITSALTAAYQNAGEKEKSMALGKTMPRSRTDSLISVINEAVLTYQSGDVEGSIPKLESAMSIIKARLKTMPAADRLPFLKDRGETMNDLTMVYTRTGKYDKAYRNAEESRNQYLAGGLGLPSSTVAPLAQVQAMLKPTEVIIYLNHTHSTEYFFNVVSKTAVNGGVIDDFNIFSHLKFANQDELEAEEKKMAENEIRAPYFLRAAKYDDVTIDDNDMNIIFSFYRSVIQNSGNNEKSRARAKAFGAIMYRAFIDAMGKYLEGKDQLIFVLDGALNYLPMETFIDHKTGGYLVEDHDISYVPSATVLQLLRTRNYPATRQPVLAMGGAQYNEGHVTSASVKSVADIDRLRNETMSTIESRGSVIPVFKALGYDQLHYLPGTLAEVNNIKKTYPAAVVLTGESMQEKTIKDMSAAGTLANFKAIHFATHGWSNNIIPQLSGIAFCTYPETRNGEDGFLVLPEIAKLKCRADVVMLSACETALGKAYGSEGVYGLTQAFFIAGSNGVISSLWPVNDMSTSLLGAAIYKNVSAEKMSWPAALNAVKRDFILGNIKADGMDLTAPAYWSTFIYNGR